MTLIAEMAFVGGAALLVAAIALVAMRNLGVCARATWAVATALGYVAGHATMMRAIGWFPAVGSLLRPGEARDWLPLAVLVATGITLLAIYAPEGWGRLAGLTAAALLVVAAPMRLLAGSVYVTSEWTGAERLAHLALLAACLGVVWLLLALRRDEESPSVSAGLLVLVALGAAAVLAMSGVAVYGQLSGVVAAALAGAMAGAWYCGQREAGRRRLGTSSTSDPATCDAEALAESVARAASASIGVGGAAGVVTLALGSLVLLGHYFAEVTALDALLVGVAAIVAAGWLPTSISQWRRTVAVVRTMLCVGAIGWAIARCLMASSGVATSPYGV